MHKLIELSLEVTNECSLSCLHCSSGSTNERMENELSYYEHRRLIEEAMELGATVLSLSGGNPLLYNKLPRLMACAESMRYERILIYTTGHNHGGCHISTGLDVLWIAANIKNVTWIFSMHSHLPAVNDFIMNKRGAWAAIKSSIKFLREMGQRVEIHMVPMKPNYTHIPRVRDMCADLDVQKMSLLRFVPQTRGFDNRDELAMNTNEFVHMQTIIHQERSRVHTVQLRTGCPIDFRHAIGLLDDKAKPCHAGDDLILVRPDGSVHPCAAWKSLPADVNVRNMSLREIWHDSTVFNEIREFKDIGYETIGGSCSTCSKVNSCRTGCLAQRLHASDSIDIADLYLPTSDPLCPRR